MNVLISNVLTMAQYSLIGAIYFEYKQLPPGLIENKVASCLGTFFMGNMFTSGLTKTNAFEIYLDEKLLWSTLKTQRKPDMDDLEKSFKKVGVAFNV